MRAWHVQYRANDSAESTLGPPEKSDEMANTIRDLMNAEGWFAETVGVDDPVGKITAVLRPDSPSEREDVLEPYRQRADAIIRKRRGDPYP